MAYLMCIYKTTHGFLYIDVKYSLLSPSHELGLGYAHTWLNVVHPEMDGSLLLIALLNMLQPF